MCTCKVNINVACCIKFDYTKPALFIILPLVYALLPYVITDEKINDSLHLFFNLYKTT